MSEREFGTADESPVAEPPSAQRPEPKHRHFLDDVIAQMRTGKVAPTLADGPNPIYFRPLGHGGENMVLSGMRLPLHGTPHNVPYVLKIGLYEASEEDLREHRGRMKELQGHTRHPEWFLHEHHLLHRCPDGEQRLVTLQQPVELEGTMHLSSGYAELRTDWNQTDIGTVGPETIVPGRLPKLQPDDPYIGRYTRVNQALVLDCADDDAPQIGREEFLATQRSKPLSALANQARRDSGMRRLLRDFVERAIEYSDKTGEIIDVIGEGDNVVFHRPDGEEGRWNIAMLDALHPSKRSLSRLRPALTRLSSPHHHSNSNDPDVINALNGLNYVRTINGLARLLNMRERLMRWRSDMDEASRRMVDFPLILERCRAASIVETSKHTAGETPPDAMPCPREKLQIIMRIAPDA